MKTRTMKLVAVLLAICLLAGGLSACGESGPSEKELTAVREALIKENETEGLGDITAMEFYENGERTTSEEYIQVKDNKKIYWSGDIKRVVNYADGYILDIPQDWQPDYSLATVRCRYVSDEVTLIGTNEDDALKDYKTGDKYIEDIFQYITSKNSMKKNNVEKLGETTETYGKYKAYVLRMHLKDCPEGYKCYYTYVVYYDDASRMVQLMFKCVDDRDFSDVYSSFKGMYAKGTSVDTITYPCEANPNWNEETKAYYDSIANSDKVSWGVFVGNLDQSRVLKAEIPSLEKKLDYEFPIIMSYSEMDWDYPSDGAQDVVDMGRHLQFTYHTSEWRTTNTMGDYSDLIDLYRGNKDEDLTRMAGQIAESAHPILFRLNNEMNSNWTIWSAVNCMLDPEIFTEAWIRQYNIFTEYGANQYCIWVWNTQGCQSYPNTNWNEARTYMPGPEYVDMIGLTSYNFGDEYTWNTFQSMYDADQAYFGKYFGDWAWIIGEFGCSDTEKPSRKAQWITEMFDCFEQNRYPNIKAAVWFSRNDYASDGVTVTHRLILNESQEILDAFKDGLKRTQ